MLRIEHLTDHVDKEVRLSGWVHAIRAQKRMQFIILRDATGKVQGIVDRQNHPELGKKLAHLTRESTIEITGTVVRNPQVELGGLEIQVSDLKVYSLAEPTPPIDPSSSSKPGVETRMDWRFLDLRRPENRLIFEIQTEIEAAMREYWKKESFIEIHTPKLMATASESGAELFEAGYFSQKAYLAQSPKFYKQMAMASGFDRVFEIAPVFRANPSFTSRTTPNSRV
jgi:aspartyl/asparaginyl-tRNA synthetase